MQTFWRRFFRVLIASALACALATGGAIAAFGEAAETSEAEAVAEAQSALADLFADYDTLGACVCVIENGRIAHTFCYGTLSPEGEPVTAATLFRVGSISKMVTAMGVMRLVEGGQTSLDADLSDILGYPVRNPRYPDTAVTLRQVMCHTAGLRDGGFYTRALRGLVSPLDTLFAKRGRYAFYVSIRPGSRYEYSNFGGGLLGVVIESLTGETVDAYMSRAVFEPLSIAAAYQGALLPTDATVADLYAMPAGTLSADVRGTEEAVLTPDPLTDYTLTAGKLTLSAPDLAKLIIALCDGGVYGNVHVLSESSVVQMLTAQNDVGSVSCESGWGLDVSIQENTLVEGRTLYGHGGKANGMLCAAFFDPADRTGVVMLTNGCNSTAAMEGMGKLSVLAVRLCYSALIDGRHVTQDPWLVGGE